MNNSLINNHQGKIDNSKCEYCPSSFYLSFNFSFVVFNSENYDFRDIKKLIERIKFLSSQPYKMLVSEHKGDKERFFELIGVDKIRWVKEPKAIPIEFRKIHPTETNEKFAIMRVYPKRGPKNARLIGMIKRSIFYVF